MKKEAILPTILLPLLFFYFQNNANAQIKLPKNRFPGENIPKYEISGGVSGFLLSHDSVKKEINQVLILNGSLSIQNGNSRLEATLEAIPNKNFLDFGSSLLYSQLIKDKNKEELGYLFVGSSADFSKNNNYEGKLGVKIGGAINLPINDKYSVSAFGSKKFSADTKLNGTEFGCKIRANLKPNRRIKKVRVRN